MEYLDVLDSKGRRRQVALDRPRLLIGRDPSCDIHLPHLGVSRCHAQLQKNELGQWMVQDLNSKNHVYLDEKPVQQIVLQPEKPFRIAEYWLALKVPIEVKAGEETSQFSPIPDTVDVGMTQPLAWLEQLHNFQRSLAPLQEPEQVLERLSQEIRRFLQPQVLAIGLTKPEGYAWEIVHSDNQSQQLTPCLEEASQHVKEEQSSIQSWVLGNGQGGGDGKNGSTHVLFPMKGRQKVLGHVFVYQPCFNPLPLPLKHFIGLMAHFSGLVWDNLQLVRHRRAQIEVEKELLQARRIQTGLFPPSFKVDPRLDAYAINFPSARVSGDYYDLFPTGPNTVAFVIADAMGHGMPAALLMAGVRAALRMGLSLHLQWKDVFKGLDDLIHQGYQEAFVTGVVGQIDLAAQEISLVLAGHPPPLILVDGKTLTIPPHCHTRPWGLKLETSWDEARLSLRGKHWSILCYTDGVTDAGPPSQRSGLLKKLERFHQENFSLPAEDLCHRLLKEVAVQPAAGSLFDDQTVLALCSEG